MRQMKQENLKLLWSTKNAKQMKNQKKHNPTEVRVEESLVNCVKINPGDLGKSRFSGYGKIE